MSSLGQDIGKKHALSLVVKMSVSAVNFISELRQAFDIHSGRQVRDWESISIRLSSQDRQFPDIIIIALPGVDVRNAGYSSPLYTRIWWQME